MVIQIIRPDDGSDPMGPGGFGRVPTLGGDVSTSIPDPVTGVSPTQTQQGVFTATQSVAQAIVIPPAPYQVINRLDPSGSLTMWFQTLIRKLGGYTATPLDDALIITDELSTPSDDTTLLFSAINSLPDPTLAIVSSLAAQVEALTVMVEGMQANGWDRQPAQAAALPVAPAGGVGTAAGGWDTAANRDTAIAYINNLGARLSTLEAANKTVGITF